MLLELTIENYILIDRQTVFFENGLNVITGETGAGKSLVLGALEIVFGGRTDKAVIRRGSSTAFIQVLMDATGHVEILDFLDQQGLGAEDGLLTLSREIKAEGKSISRINGRALPIGVVKEFSALCFEMTGQHDQQRMLQQQYQMMVLDGFAGEAVIPLKKEIKGIHEDIRSLEKELSELDMSDEEARLKLDLIGFQIDEIEEAAFKPNEYTDLEDTYRAFKHSERIIHTLDACHEKLDGDRGVLRVLSTIMKELGQIEGYGQNLHELKPAAESIYYEMEALRDSLRVTLERFESTDMDPATLESRFNLLNHFKRKYGSSHGDLQSHLDSLKRQKESLEGMAERKLEILSAIEKKKRSYENTDNQLFEIRQAAAKVFDRQMVQELADLNFDAPRFESRLESTGRLSDEGGTTLTFMISSNLGESLKDMSKVASGGELSRIMLAVKCLQGRRNQTPILVYDEIDTGISGKTASMVGEKIHKTSLFSQVLCVTHLPQIAVFANHHITVEKFADHEKESTVATIAVLGESAREMEIVRMISGEHLSEHSKNNAMDMLGAASRMKERHKHELKEDSSHH